MHCVILPTPSYSAQTSSYPWKNFSRKRKCEEDSSDYGFLKSSRIQVLAEDIKVADYQWTFEVGNEYSDSLSFDIVDDVLIISCDLKPRPGYGTHSVRRRIPLPDKMDPNSLRICFDSLGHLLIGAWRKRTS
uniref:SHSP domain-containing protein n=1 Tax=Acrobeloides nanus TaxID=290746 RepID=A0A914CIP9_9BILA